MTTAASAAVKAAIERLAPDLTRVLRVMLQWEHVRAAPPPASPVAGDEDAEGADDRCQRLLVQFPWDLVSMHREYPSLAEVLGKFNQIELLFEESGPIVEPTGQAQQANG